MSEKGQSPQSRKQNCPCLDTLKDSRLIPPTGQVKGNSDFPFPFYRRARICLLIEPKVKAIAPNIALMKWARWCECQGIKFQYVRGKVVPGITPDIMLMSCIFSFYSKKYEETITFYKKRFPDVPIVVGGVFPTLNPKWFADRWNGRLTDGTPEVWLHRGLCNEIEGLPPKFNILIKCEGTLPYPRDKIVAYASRGCVNRCGYCAVPRIEGGMKSFKTIKNVLDTASREIPNAKSIVLYDNNFTKHTHFENIVNELVQYGLPVDIHGLHVDSFTERHAQMLSKLKWSGQGASGTPYIRFSFDKFEYAANIERAARLVAKYKINATFFCYMLFNFKDSPHDIWKRIAVAQKIVNRTGVPITLFPQRYEPLNTLKKRQYIGPKWTDDTVRGLAKIATRLRGFLPVTKTDNIFRWIGHTEEEFVEKLQLAGQKGEITKTSTQVQPSPGDSKEHLTDKYATCREEIAEMAIADIQPCPIIPDYKTPTLSTQPIVVRTPDACFCIDGWHYIEQAKADDRSTIRCLIHLIAHHSIIELAIRKAAIRVMPQGGQCSYSEKVRNTHRLRQALESTSDNLGMFTHGGDRRGVGFTDSKASNVRVVLASRLGKSPTTISKYLQHGDSLNDAVMEELVNSGAPKTFFEAFQTEKDIRKTALRVEKKGDAAIVAEISSLVSAWWNESQRPTQPKTTPPEKPQPPQPGRATGPTRPSTRDSRGSAPRRRTPPDSSDAGGNPTESDTTPANQEGVSAELKRIGEALIGIAENQESPTPQQIESIRTLIFELSTLLSRVAPSIGAKGDGNGRAN